MVLFLFLFFFFFSYFSRSLQVKLSGKGNQYHHTHTQTETHTHTHTHTQVKSSFFPFIIQRMFFYCCQFKLAFHMPLNKSKWINIPKKSEHNFPKETILLKKMVLTHAQMYIHIPFFNITLINIFTRSIHSINI